MLPTEFRLTADRLTHSGTTRHFRQSDFDQFAAWTIRYHALAGRPDTQDDLHLLGQAIHVWLDGDENWLTALRDQADAPIIAEFAVQAAPNNNDRRFLEVPWELAATPDGWLAADPAMMWAPLRRIGPRSDPPQPEAAHRLGIMFMAAAPTGQTELDIEQEEAAILRATANLGLDLIVEDTGELPELSQAWARIATLNALHLSCHGMGGETPWLALENATGDLAKVSLDDLAGAFVQGKPRLLFLSACHTGQGGDTVDSLARGLIRVGFPAVLGWADAVFDRDASDFAAAFYRRAAQPNMTVQAAWAATRYDLLRLPRPPAHWHLARLFLGRSGGGSLAAGTAARLRDDHDAGRKGVLEAPGRQIEVASRFEFVGRRRQTQAIQRAFRHRTHAGAVILGLGRQGKSSLAARIIDRQPALTPVVLFRTCDGPTLLAEISRKIDAAAEICARYRDSIDPNRPGQYDPDALYHALRALLQGPCGHRNSKQHPILLLLDDFEDLLQLPPDNDNIARVKPEAAAPLSAIIRAFDAGGTESRLLITCRYGFRLPDQGRDLAARLLAVNLPSMSAADSRKQARQKLAAAPPADAPDPAWFADFQKRAIAAARGNAGLQDLLFRAALTDPQAGEAATAALETHLKTGALPEHQELRDTLEHLAIRQLLGWLTKDERHFLDASTLFQLPVPSTVWTRYAADAGRKPPDRLPSFGLWERFPDLVNPRTDAMAPNPVAAALLASPDDATSEQIIRSTLPTLFTAWGYPNRAGKPTATDIELTRLALRSGNLEVLAATAQYAIRGHEAVFAFRAAAQTAEAALAALDAGGRPINPGFLRAAAEVFDHVGDADALKRIYAKAPSSVADEPDLPQDERIARAQFRIRFAGWLQQRGEPDRALAELRAAESVFDALGDRRSRAVTLGDIARIMRDKGDVDQALELHREAIQAYEALGDRRSRAVTLGDIARIMRDKGDVDQALNLHREEMQTYDALGDRRSRAVTLGDIARIMRDKGDVDQALELHREELQTYEALGDRRSRAMTLGDIARIMRDKGDVDQALELHREELQTYEALGDRRSRAITLGDIARIMTAEGDVDQALEIHREAMQTYEALGDRRSRAVTLGDIARIMTAKGDVDQALELHRERIQTYEALGDRRSRAIALGDIARIMRAKGDVDQALETQQQRLEVNEALGDQDGIAGASFDIGQILLGRAIERSDAPAFEAAFKALARSYHIYEAIGRLEGICVVGEVLGQVLARAGQPDEARPILIRSRDGYRRLGRTRDAGRIEALLDQLP